MKILLLILLLLCFWVIWIVYPIQKAIKKSKVIQENAIAYEQHPSASTMRILVMGDSTALGAGSEPASSVAGLLGKKYPNADIVNISRFGMRLNELQQEIRALPATSPYNLIILQIGANDVTHFTPLTSVTETLTTILDDAEKKGSHIILLSSGNIGLSPVFRFPISTILSKRTRDVREIYIAETRNRPNVSYIDLYENRSSDTFSIDINKYYAADRFHPSADGYMVWFKEIEKQLPE